LHDEEMPCVAASDGLDRHADAGKVGERGLIARSHLLTPALPRREVRELSPAHGGRDVGHVRLDAGAHL